METLVNVYPVQVSSCRDATLSRWLWLAKWLLALPHFLILAVLWVAVAISVVVAYLAILLTGRYPRPLFDFVVGVMRWTWRVQHYAYAALGTDRYPPFTLRDVVDYPARLSVVYPARLSRRLALVKWWLLALPHYVVVGFFLGGTVLAARGDELGAAPWVTGGLVGLLVLVAGVVLAVSGSYPAPIYDMVVGMDRWAIRVTAYALGLTDAYPPFRLDMGGPEPTAPAQLGPPADPPAGPAQGWSGGRIGALGAGAVLTVGSLGVVITGGLLAWADQTQRDAEGYLGTHPERFVTTGYAIAGPPVLNYRGLGWATAAVGTVKIEAAASEPGRTLFLGVGRSADVDAYLAGVPHTVAHGLGRHARVEEVPGAAVPAPPTAAGIWTTSASGAGTQSVLIDADAEGWSVVALNADGSAGVDVTAEVSAEMPALPWLAGGLLGAGGVALAGGLLLMVAAAARAARHPVAVDRTTHEPQPVA